jgi:ATP-dependent RNA helicase A
MASMDEREISFELLCALLEYIASIQIPGAVLVFLPGWAQIFACLKHLQQALVPDPQNKIHIISDLFSQ